MNPSHNPQPGSVTLLLRGVFDEDEAKTKAFWDIFFPRLVRVANKILRSHQDAEDAAQESLVKFWIQATSDKVSKGMDRFGIWAFLSKITTRQALDFLKHRGRKKRGGGNVYVETEIASMTGEDDWDLDSMVGDLSFHAFDMVIDEILGALSEESREILVWRMMGFSYSEISRKMDCSEKTVQRRIERIREHIEQTRA
jgi:RNA polymerase sigma factor (sigma-70 family)